MNKDAMVAALSRLSGRDLIINLETADEFVADLTRFSTTSREDGVKHEIESREALCAAYGFENDRDVEDRKPFVYQDGIGVIPVHGALLNRFSYSWGFATGYNFIRRQLNAMLDDDDVKGIIFDVNTPGGEASGCFELGREIIASRRVKPSLAMVDALMASGGVGVAGCASTIYAIPSARIGSIGVYRQHVSVEAALKEAGVKITFAQAGEHKLDGQPYKDLPDSVLRDWTQDVNRTWDDFIAIVAESRGLDEDAVRATQAKIYRADEALALGLIDGVKTTADAVPAFVAEMADGEPSGEEDDEMTDTKKGSEATSGIDYDRIGTMVVTAVQGYAAAQDRRNAIREHGKSKGQVALAAKLAGNDAITEAEAIEMIDAAAGNAKPKGKDKVERRGKRERVSANDDDDGGDDDDDDDLDDDAQDDDDDAGDDDDDEDGEQQARDKRRQQRVRGQGGRDKVNHFDAAMKGGRREKVGSGEGDDGDAGLTGDAKATASLLGDHAHTTGRDLRQKKSA